MARPERRRSTARPAACSGRSAAQHTPLYGYVVGPDDRQLLLVQLETRHPGTETAHVVRTVRGCETPWVMQWSAIVPEWRTSPDALLAVLFTQARRTSPCTPHGLCSCCWSPAVQLAANMLRLHAVGSHLRRKLADHGVHAILDGQQLDARRRRGLDALEQGPLQPQRRRDLRHDVVRCIH